MSQPFILNRNGGGELVFPLLSPSLRVKLLNAFRKARKEQLRDNLELTGVRGEAATLKLNEFDGRRLTDGDAVRWVNELAGQVEAVRLSLSANKPGATDADVDALDLTNDELFRVAAGVMNLRIVEAAPAEGGEFPLPESPPVAGASEIGSATPA